MFIMNVEPVNLENELFISDLDGTLLSPQHEISPYTKRILTEAIERGLKFTVASARSFFSIKQLLSDVPLALPIITNNGAALFSADGNCLYRACVEDTTLDRLYATIIELELTPLLTVEGNRSKLYYSSTCDGHTSVYMQLKSEAGDRRLEALDEIFAVKEGIITLTLLGEYEKMHHALETLGTCGIEGINLYLMALPDIDGLYTLTIISKEADKGRTLNRLRQILSSDLHVTAFGDHLNDLSLFQEADTRVAVGNAERALKEEADHICGSNDQEGVAQFIAERLGLK